MSKRIKNLVSSEIEKRLKGADSVVVVDYIGISANDTNRLRSKLRAKKVRMTVIPNAQGSRALDRAGLKGAEKILSGTNALVYGGESVVDVVKELVEQAKEIAKLRIKGAVVEGQLLDKGATEALAKMPSKKELQSMVVGQIAGPGRKLAGQIVGPGRTIAGQIKALIEKKEKESPAAA
ncbi:MAG: 50S ribosomal protein L10 [Phycisphaerae bacterium]